MRNQGLPFSAIVIIVLLIIFMSAYLIFFLRSTKSSQTGYESYAESGNCGIYCASLKKMGESEINSLTSHPYCENECDKKFNCCLSKDKIVSCEGGIKVTIPEGDKCKNVVI